MEDQPTVPSEDDEPTLIGLYIIPLGLFQPSPGDIICLVNGGGIIHRLSGPYHPLEIEDVLSRWANDNLECHDRFAFYYEPLDGDEPITGEASVWHEFHLN